MGGTVEKKICKHIARFFDAVKKELVANTENLLEDMRNSIRGTRENFAAQKAQAEMKAKTYETILYSLSAITCRVMEIRKQCGLD